MNSTTRNTGIVAVIILVLAVLGFLAWHEREAAMTPGQTSSATSTGVSINISSSTITSSNSGYTINPVYATSSISAPNYEAPLVFSDPTLTASEETSLQSEFAQAQAGIKQSPSDFGSWIELGILHKEAGDYQGAATDWNYVTQIYPSDPTAFADLGDLYATYLNEPSQGIVDYKEAIKLDPTHEVSFYENLAQIYISENDTADAKTTLEQGISAQVAGYQNLQTMLSSMQ